jgi:hypothetical protein
MSRKILEPEVLIVVDAMSLLEESGSWACESGSTPWIRFNIRTWPE